MYKLENVIRPHLLELAPYSTARDDFQGEAQIFLDANENPHGSVIHGPFSRYPDPHQKLLRKSIARMRGITPEQVFIGHGSDEGIELIIRACCAPGRDSILVMPPTYTVYQVSARINEVHVVEVPLTPSFAIDTETVLAMVTPNTKVMFICSPNNPTGTVQPVEVIEELCRKFDGLVVVDEAYIDFCPANSVVGSLAQHANLLVLQTLSKAWGLPSLRIGMVLGSPTFLAILSKIKAPYNISGVTQALAVRGLAQEKRKLRMVEQIVSERERLVTELSECSLVKEIVPSEANFLLVRFDQPGRIYQELLKRGVIVRDRSTQLHCEGGLRITIGTPLENHRLLTALLEIGGEKVPPLASEISERRSVRKRVTSETAIEIDLALDGTGETWISTGLGFFDHMLQQIGKHAGLNLGVAVQGDLDIDEHHTIEDVGIAFGEALREALGDKRGIERYGFTAPMDEAQASVSMDFSGRAFLVWNVEFERESVGDVPTELFKHFFHSLADGARMTLHISAHGENDHHLIEGVFKAFARALRTAVAKTGSSDIPSTKGTL